MAKSPTLDPRVDAYIAAAAPFARPILERVCAAFHAGCPDLSETIKWGVPMFQRNGILGGMSAFKAHVGFGFEWVTEAKREETRAKRLTQTVAWLAEGKRRNWRYE